MYVCSLNLINNYTYMEYKEWEQQNILDELRVKIMVSKDKNDFARVRELQQKIDKIIGYE